MMFFEVKKRKKSMESTELSLDEKIKNFIKKETGVHSRPLSSSAARKSILTLREAGISFDKITLFLKEELNIEVSMQAVAKKHKALMAEKEGKNE